MTISFGFGARVLGLLLLGAAACASHASAQARVDQCVTCHGALPQAELSSPVTRVRADVHGANGVRCVDCHGGDAAAADKARAKDPARGFGAAPLGTDNVCGTCHAVFATKFATSAHAAIFESACVECHGNHGVSKPSDTMIGASKDALCWTCHEDPTDAGSVAAGKMRDSIEKLKGSLASNSDLIARARNAGMEVSDQELALAEVRTKLTQARTEVHTFDPAAVEAVVSEGMKGLTAVERAGNQAFADLRYRRRGLFISLGAILLVVIALTLKIRNLNPHGH